MNEIALLYIAVPFDEEDRMDWIPEDAVIKMFITPESNLSDDKFMEENGLQAGAAMCRHYKRKKDEQTDREGS